MNKLEEIINIGFKINWKFIQIGYLGFEYIPQQIDKDDIKEYGYHLIEKMNDSFELIVQLLDELPNDYEFNEILKKLAQRENSKQELQTRKWIVYLTKKMIETIDTLDDDFFEKLINITEFWVLLDQPENSPHIFQGVNNIISPEEYYTKDMYDLIIDKHKKWIEKEIKEIILLENE